MKIMIIPVVLFAGVLVPDVSVRAQNSAGTSEAIAEFLDQQIRAGNVVGAQVLDSSIRLQGRQPTCLGIIGPQDSRPVTADTVFCIGSSSKPIASALIFALCDRRQMRLNQPIGEVIPAMRSLLTVGGMRTRGPTVQELLTHRGGIYSQKQRLNNLQARAIRDFSLTLVQSTGIIAKQPLASVPGTDYAYSGAGYCLLGAMAEKATESSVEQLLQEIICKPLKMSSTTYFPEATSLPEIAIGGINGGTAPHLLGPQLKLPLVGGSLYSNATDIERFSRMVALGGSLESNQVMSPVAHSHFISQPVANQPYGHGWTLTVQRRRVVAVSHMGSLPPYQSAIRVNLYDKTYRIVLWTLARPNDGKTMADIKNRIAALVK